MTNNVMTPTTPDFALALQLHQSGQVAQAEAAYQAILAVQPNHADALHLLGVVRMQRGDLAEAIRLIESALTINDTPIFHNNLGEAYRKARRYPEARRHLERALTTKPDYADAWVNMGNLHWNEGRLDEAVAAYHKALGLQESYPEAHANLGNVLRKQRDYAGAVQHFKRAIELRPAYADAWNNLGLTYGDIGENDEAMAAFKQAIALNERHAEAWTNLGGSMLHRKHYGEALACADKAQGLGGDNAYAHAITALAAKEVGDFDMARAAFRQASSLDAPERDFHHLVHVNVLFFANYDPDATAEGVFDEYRQWNARHAAHLLPERPLFANDRSAARRLRIGYVSADFNAHAVRNFLLPLLEHHDHAGFEVHAYSDVKRPDNTSEVYRRCFDHWIDAVPLNDDALFERIRADGIDILVDLAGHTDGNRLRVFARKPAPVQVSWLGFGYTTGLTAMDYFLGDDRFTPAGCDQLFSERLWRLPRTAFVYRPPDYAPAVSELPALRNGQVTFGSLSRVIRFNDHVVSVWSRILKAVPGSRLLLNNAPFSEAAICEKFTARFVAHGVTPDRLKLEYAQPHWDSYHEIDICLDPFPHNAGTTTFESLWMGVPVLSKLDRPSVGRFGATILGNLELDEWVVADEDGYVSAATRLAADLKGLVALRAGLRGRMCASPMMDELGFARDVEAAYRGMWQRFVQQSPEPDIKCTNDLEKVGADETATPMAQNSLPAEIVRQRLTDAANALIGGRLGEAEALYRDLQTHGVEDHGMYANLGVIARRRHDLPLARQYYEHAIVLQPKNAPAHANLARLLRDIQERPAAVAAFRRAMELEPKNPNYPSMLANLLREMGDANGAEQAARQALAIDPEHIEANLNLGSSYRHRLELEAAIAQYQRVLELDPKCADALSNLGSIYKDRAQFDRALEMFDRAIALEPEVDTFKANALFCLNYHPTLSPETIFTRFVQYGRQLSSRLGKPCDISGHDRSPARRLRLGYVSADFKNHVVRYFIQFLLEKHDRNQFELVAYSNVEGEDAMSGWFRARFDHWRDIQALTDQQAANLVHADKIDVLIDLSGHTARNRLGIFALKPAPLSLTWLGFGTTTGLSQIDYFLGDERFTPPGSEHFFSEHLVRLDRSPFCYRPPEGAPPDVGGLPARRKGCVTFGCLSRTVRYNERVVATWAKLLHAVPGSKLRLDNKPFEDPETVALFMRRFAQHGIDANRLEFACSRPHWDAFREIDIALDPFPHNAGTTTIDALLMGVPVLSLRERPPVGRFGATLLHAVGLDNWLVDDEAAYVARGQEVANDWEALERLRGALRARLEASTLRDEVGFTRVFEQTLRLLWQAWCAGETHAAAAERVSAHWRQGAVHEQLLAAQRLDRSGEAAAASDAYRKVLKTAPGCFEAATNLTHLLTRQGDLPGAIAAAEQAVAAQPENVLGHQNIANLFYTARRWAQAEGAARLATLLDPGRHRAWSILGNALRQLGRVVESIAAYREALRCALPEARVAVECDLAGVLKDMACFDEAMAIFEHLPTDHPSRAMGDEIRLFIANYHPDLSPEAVARIYAEWDERYALPLRPASVPQLADPLRRRPRVGYVSGDYRHHAVRFFLEPLLSHHDREAFELFAYSDVVAQDGWTERYRRYFDHWADTRSLTDVALAERIRADGIDILVDLAGHTADNRLFVFARKPAPIQVSWLGFGYTTGLSAIDWFLGDERLTPPGCESLFREQIWRLPRPVFVYRPGEEGFPDPGFAPHRKHQGAITFGCFSRSVRYNDRVLDAWAAILKRVPGSFLLLNHRPFGDSQTAAEFRARFARRGIAPFRLKFGFHTPPGPAYREIDIALDPFPHNGGTTTFEALWMGVPVVSIRDRISMGRFGDTLLSAIGLSYWVADSVEQYIERAVELAGKPDVIDDLRGGLRERMRRSPLMDEAGFARAVEVAYRGMWRQAGGAPLANVQASSSSPIAPPRLDEVIKRHKSGDWAAAEAGYRAYLEWHPRHYQALMNLGVVLSQTLRKEEAAEWMRKSIEEKPDYVVGLSNLGTVLRDLGRLDEAMDAFERALALKPDYAEAHNNLGTIYKDRLEWGKAESHFRQAMAYRTDYVTAINNLAGTLVLMGRIKEAEASAQQASILDPRLAEPEIVLGQVRHDEGDLEAALECFSNALMRQGDSIPALLGAASTLSRLKLYEKSEQVARQVLRLDLGNREATLLLVHNLRKLGQPSEALALAETALVRNPDDARLIEKLGSSLVDLAEFDAAMKVYERGVTANPLYGTAFSSLLFAANYHPDMSAEQVAALYRGWDDQYAKPLRPHKPLYALQPVAGRRLRVGYVSGDFRAHAAQHFMMPLLQNHDHGAVEVFAYSQGAREDDVTEAFKGLVDHWRRNVGVSDEALANQIVADGIDVLVDLSGHTAGSRLLVFARKPAPVQVSWLGFGTTTGLSAMDWFLGDERFTPWGCEPLFSEKIWRLPCAFCYQPPESAPQISALPAQGNGYVTFGSLTRSIRLNPRVIAAWAQILQRVPESRLMLNSKTFKEAASCDHFATAFSQHGIGRDRLVMCYTRNWDGYRAIDVMLDPFPHNAGTTTFEALWMGVPMVSKRDRPSVGRFGDAILAPLGLSDWVVDAVDAYVERAVLAASDRDELMRLRDQLRDRMRNSVLCDAPAFARTVEAAYQEMYASAPENHPSRENHS